MAIKTTLSDRLQCVAGMVKKGGIACDVGCDHGFVSIYLIEQEICSKVIAMDVREGPLLAAKEHVQERGLLDYIDIRLSDGLDKLLPGEGHSLICAGMGGRLITKILEQEYAKAHAMQELILQPQSEVYKVREFLRKNKYVVTKEEMVFEGDKYYSIIKAVPTEDELAAYHQTPLADEITREILDRYGELLLFDKHPVLHRFLEYEYAVTADVLKKLEDECESEKLEKRRGELRNKLKMNILVKKRYG